MSEAEKKLQEKIEAGFSGQASDDENSFFGIFVVCGFGVLAIRVQKKYAAL